MKDFGTSFYCVSENAMTVPNSDYIWHNPSISIWQTFQCIWVIFTLSLSLKWSISGGFFVVWSLIFTMPQTSVRLAQFVAHHGVYVSWRKDFEPCIKPSF